MTKKLLLLYSLFYIHLSFSQEDRKFIFGIIKADSLSVENIHIVNKNTNKGTLSNEYGEFKIPVKENDTLLFSAIQFQKKELIITKQNFNNLAVSIYLKAAITNLEEVIINQHNLTGTLTIDSENYKDQMPKINPDALDFSNIDFSKPVVSDEDFVDKSKPPDAGKLTDPNIPVGGNVLGLLSPLIDKVKNIGRRKRKLRAEKNKYFYEAKNAPDNIRNDFGDMFFTTTLKIPVSQIDHFIKYCQPKGIIDLYLNDQKIELTELMINESKVFLKPIKNEE